MRPHGLRGEVVVELVSNRAERTRPGASFHSAQGALRAVAVRPFQGRWLMTFDGVEDRHAAEALRGTVLEAEALEDDGAMWVHRLVGATVLRSSDAVVVGRVAAVVANPASDLLELEDGRLVPLRFVVRAGDGRVEIDPPPGLLDP